MKTRMSHMFRTEAEKQLAKAEEGFLSTALPRIVDQVQSRNGDASRW